MVAKRSLLAVLLAPVAFAAVLLAAVLASPGLSWAKSKWWGAADVSAKVHEHTFHRLSVNDVGCQVRVRLFFDAPHGVYNDAVPARNHYRFRAELKLSDGKRIVTEVFDNAEAGPRVFAFSHDTEGQGCWAEAEHKLRKLDVHACRGPRCVPEVFE